MASRLERLSVSSSARLLAVFGALVGLLCGVLYAGGGLIIDLVTGNLGLGTLLAFGALLGMPLIGAAGGGLTGTVAAYFYNVAARVVGGVEFDLRGPENDP